MTKVKFLIEKDGEGVFAYFPNERYNSIDIGVFMCYAHIGQHSGCHWQYADECREATPEEYKDLLKELIYIGYNDLEIENELKENSFL